MDKNMINIDDLFRQRLGGGEEKERPGSWLQMKDLLDKEMPVAATGGNTMNWRRMFGYAAGLLLVASVTIGGYNAITTFRNTENASPVAPATGGGVTATGSVNSNNNNTQQVPSSPANSIDNNKQASTLSNTSIGEAGKTTGNYQGLAAANNTPSGQQSTTNVAADKPANNTSAATSANVQDNKATANTAKPTSQPAVASGSTTTKTATNDNKSTVTVNKNGSDNSLNNNNSGNNIETAASNNKPGVATTTSQANTTAANKQTATPGNNATPEKMFASGNSTTNDNKKPQLNQPIANKPGASSNTSGSATSKNEVAKNDNLKKNMIDKVEERETYDRKTGVWKKDTIDKGKVEWTKEEEQQMVAKAKDKDAGNTAIVPAASVQAKAGNDAEKLVPLSDFRTSTKNGNYQTTNVFEEMVKNAKLQLGGVRFYPGLIVGINTALSGKNSMTGFQAGVTGALSLNDKWGIVSELKYVQRFRNGNRESNRNDYISSWREVPGTAGREWEMDSVSRYFTYPNVSSVELPIMLRYSLNRFNLMGGANVAYFMPVNANSVENTYTVRRAVLPPPSGVMTTADFGSRFGVGYLFSVGYQVSPAVQLDVRMAQSVWDNAAGYGAERVSKEVFQLPSLQFNMSYRFSSNKYKPYRSH